MATIKDVAKRANVSTATVSHVINQTRFVADETKNSVFKAMEELGYVPNAIARGLRTRATRNIGLLVPDISNPFFSELAECIEAILEKKGFNLVLGNTHENPAIEERQIISMQSNQVQGIIMAPADRNRDYSNLIDSDRVSVVFVDRKTEMGNYDAVLTEHRRAAYDATMALLKQGHQKIGFLGSTTKIYSNDERIEGYKKALQEANLEVQDSLIKKGHGSNDGQRMMSELIKENRPTAVFVANSSLVIGVYHALRKIDIETTGQLQIISFDDNPWAEVMSPPLTTIRQPIEEISRIAVETLERRMEHKEDPMRVIHLPARIIYRGFGWKK